MSAVDHAWMSRALQLARRGRYSTSPNPQVGCVLVKNDDLVAEAWHQRAGEGHAEALALAAAGDDAKGATAYVTLEPCSHVGRTPPCADALIAAAVKRVVVACLDPNPLVAGNGVQRLLDAGIEVTQGVLESQAQAVNAGFMRRIAGGLPRVHAKLASSLDGRTAMASGESQWITGEPARNDVQGLRAAACAIVTGIDSVIHDGARLNVRSDMLNDGSSRPGEGWRQPLRVVMDSQMRLPPDSALLQCEGPVLVASVHEDADRKASLQRAGAEVLVLPATGEGRVDPEALLRALAERECNEVLLECGPRLMASFFQRQLVDSATVYMAPCLLGASARPLVDFSIDTMASKWSLAIDEVRAVGDDWRIDLRPRTEMAS